MKFKIFYIFYISYAIIYSNTVLSGDCNGKTEDFDDNRCSITNYYSYNTEDESSYLKPVDFDDWYKYKDYFKYDDINEKIVNYTATINHMISENINKTKLVDFLYNSFHNRYKKYSKINCALDDIFQYSDTETQYVKSFYSCDKLIKWQYKNQFPNAFEYQIEHVWPKSRGMKGNSQMRNDLINLRISEPTINQWKSAKIFDECSNTCDKITVTNDKCTPHNNECCNDDTSCGNSYCFTDSTFEPHDGIKGEIARITFYLATFYNEKESKDLKLEYTAESNNKKINNEGIMANKSRLINWNSNHTVTTYEESMNTKICYWQGNRNIFIDIPDLGNYIYSTTNGDNRDIDENKSWWEKLPKWSKILIYSCSVILFILSILIFIYFKYFKKSKYSLYNKDNGIELNPGLGW